MPLSTGSVFLTGYMGAGKSAVGGILATELGLPFYDLDTAVANGEQRSIEAIFREDGEPAFRTLELTYLARLPAPAVVALGGGSFIIPQVRRHIEKQGLCVFLDWPLSILWERVAGQSERPLARDSTRFEALYLERLPLYRAADLIWRSRPPHRESVAEVAQAIAGMVRDRIDITSS